ncbi:rho GTPase-activating protein 20-like [Castor canadensis]|uniref:Rho GTPase-activating protein 20-like n=1 Tax=Castor canadensis TaxID=51338 RepID=A0AC58KU27_CASCN
MMKVTADGEGKSAKNYSCKRCKKISQIKRVIPLRIIWMDKVEEGDSSAKKSFLLGWPMENFRATFHSLEQKEKWYSFLERNIKLTKEKDNQKSLELQIFAKDFHPCPIDVTATSFDTVNDIIKKILSILGITGCENEYLLSFNSGNEEAPFSLNGHECPYAIKMNQLGEKAFIPQRPSKFTSQTFQEPILGQVSLDLKGQFFLEPRHPSKETATDKGRCPLRNWRFHRRSRSYHNNLDEFPPTTRTGLRIGISIMDIWDEYLKENEISILEINAKQNSVVSTYSNTLQSQIQEEKEPLDEQNKNEGVPGPSPEGEEYPKVSENVHVDVTNAQEAVDSTSSTRFHDSTQEEKESLEEPSQDDAMPGPSPEGDEYPKVNESVHVDVTNPQFSKDSTSSTRFHDSIQEEKELLMSQGRMM